MFLRCFVDDRAQDAFEYVLVVGVLVVAVIAGLWGFGIAVEALAGHACPAVDTAKQAVGSCVN